MALPDHMRVLFDLYAERGVPHPSDMGSFARSLLDGSSLVHVFLLADDHNRELLSEYAAYICDHVPAEARGDRASMLRWYERHRRLNEGEASDDETTWPGNLGAAE